MTMTNKLRAVGNKVIIKPDPEEGRTASGLIIAQAWQHPPCSGTVVSAGRGKYNHKGVFIPTDLEPGMRVSYKWIDVEAPQNQIEWEGVSLRVIDADLINGIVEQEVAA